MARSTLLQTRSEKYIKINMGEKNVFFRVEELI